MIALILAWYLNCRVSDATLEKINEIRGRDLCQNYILDMTATKKACDLRDRHYWSHTDPDGVPFWKPILDAGYNYSEAGEILGKGCKDCIKLWMESPSHKRIIMNPKYKEFGIGRCGEFTAVHFGRL